MKKHDSQRGWFAYELYQRMKDNDKIVVLTADLGFGQFDAIKKDFPERFYNVGAAEQAMLGIAIGLALEGKIPFCYSITPFLLFRPFETIRNYIDHENIPVKLIGGGRYSDYKHDGFSHYAGDDKRFLRNFKNIVSYWPEHKEDIPNILSEVLSNNKPSYINLTR